MCTAIFFAAPAPWHVVALIVAALAALAVLAIDLLNESARADEETPVGHIRNALCVLELGHVRVIDHHETDQPLVIVPLEHWEAAFDRLWRAVYQLEGRPPTRNTTTRQRLAEIDEARDRERLKLLVAREA